MATFIKIADYVEDINEKVHNFETDILKFSLSDTLPSSESPDPTTTGNGIFANITEISYTNYSDDLGTDRELEGITSVESSGTYTLDFNDVVITASGGPLATFRYLYVWNDTASSPVDAIVGLLDHGSGITLASTETATLQVDGSGFLTVT